MKIFNSVVSACQRGYASVKTLVVVAVTSVTSLFVAPAAMALPPDFTSLTTAIDLSTVSAAALLALAALMGLYLIISGGKTIVGFFRGK